MNKRVAVGGKHSILGSEYECANDEGGEHSVTLMTVRPREVVSNGRVTENR